MMAMQYVACNSILSNFSKKSSNSYDVSSFTPNKAQTEIIAFLTTHCDLFMCLQLSTTNTVLKRLFLVFACMDVIQLHKEYRV